MQHLPDICISICGAAVLVAAVLVWPAWRTMRRGLGQKTRVLVNSDDRHLQHDSN